MCTESNESCWSQNRRDEFEIVAAYGDETGHTVDGEMTVAEMLGTRFPVSVAG